MSIKEIEIDVDIVSDLVCPWCVIGFLNIRSSLKSIAEPYSVNFRWRSFELNPNISASGVDLQEFFLEKSINQDQFHHRQEQWLEAARIYGFNFDFHPGMRIRNTFRAHKLLFWAKDFGLQTDFSLALFEAHFSKRENIDDLDTLLRLAISVGLHGETAKFIIEDCYVAEQVRCEQKKWAGRDIFGVPTFIISDRYPIFGAQSPETFKKLFNRLLPKLQN